MTAQAALTLRRVDEQPNAADGTRILVERLWPRGLSKEATHLDGWLKDSAPSSELQRWFGHIPERWPQFRQQYQAEIQAPEQQAQLSALAEKAGPVGSCSSTPPGTPGTTPPWC